MNRGLDANVPLTRVARALKLAGYGFVARYFKQSGRPLTLPEAQALSRAGLAIVSVVERGFPTSAGYFSNSRGLEDGAWAHAFAQKVHQPAGTPIYFTVDYDAAPADLQGRIRDYFEGLHGAIAAAAHQSGVDYTVGVYGSGLTCGTLLHQQVVTHTWLAQSMGWRDSRAFTGWNIKQGRGASVFGIAIDSDVSSGDGGGWRC